MIRCPLERLHRQIDLILAAWGMPDGPRSAAVDVMTETDLRGIDSHGLAMLPIYDRYRREGRLDVAAVAERVFAKGSVAVFDARGGLGHYPTALATDFVTQAAVEHGLAAAVVRHSHHFGAAGIYADRAARAGLVALVTSSGITPQVVPTFAAAPMFGTNPLAFAAPAGRNPPFVLDMATSTVAAGKLNVAALNGRGIPVGWAVDQTGQPVTDPTTSISQRFLTPLGATPELSSHKGYGLAAMVEILSTMLAGATYCAVRDSKLGQGAMPDIGHFVLALDPSVFRPDGGFIHDVDEMIDSLHAAPRQDSKRAVLVAGEREFATRQDRLAAGIPIPDELCRQVNEVCNASGAAYILT